MPCQSFGFSLCPDTKPWSIFFGPRVGCSIFRGCGKAAGILQERGALSYCRQRGVFICKYVHMCAYVCVCVCVCVFLHMCKSERVYVCAWCLFIMLLQLVLCSICSNQVFLISYMCLHLLCTMRHRFKLVLVARSRINALFSICNGSDWDLNLFQIA
jgi:hypothetical protein